MRSKRGSAARIVTDAAIRHRGGGGHAARRAYEGIDRDWELRPPGCPAWYNRVRSLPRSACASGQVAVAVDLCSRRSAMKLVALLPSEGNAFQTHRGRMRSSESERSACFFSQQPRGLSLFLRERTRHQARGAACQFEKLIGWASGFAASEMPKLWSKSVFPMFRGKVQRRRGEARRGMRVRKVAEPDCVPL